MKLYRGTKTPPKIVTPEVREKHERAGTYTNELLLADRPQFFTSEYEIALEKAGPNGYIMTLDLPNQEAINHQEGTIRTMVNGVLRDGVENYQFEPAELEQYFKEKRIGLIDLGVNRHGEVEGRTQRR